MLKIKLLLSLLVVGSLSFAQEVTLDNLFEFDKVIIEGQSSEVILKSGNHGKPSVVVDGARDQDVKMNIEAGVLRLMLEGNGKPIVTIHNRKLRRIEGPENMVVSNANLLGSNGRYLVRSIKDGHNHSDWTYSMRHNHSDIGDIDIGDISIDIPDIDIDIDFDFDDDFEFEIEIDDDFDFDFDFDFDHEGWNFHWEESKADMREWKSDVREEVRKAVDEAKHELRKLKDID